MNMTHNNAFPGMNTHMVFPVAAVLLASCAATVSHQSLKERHLEARGGRAALEGLKVVERSGSFTFHGMKPEAHGSYHTCLRYPDHVIVDIDAGPVQVHQVLGDNGALECDTTFKVCSAANSDVAEDLKNTAHAANREELQDVVPPGTVPELIYEGSTAVGYRYTKEGRAVEVEFAPDTGLERRIKSGPRERRFGNWKDAGGVLLPMRIEDFSNGEKTVTITLTSAKHSDVPSEWCLARFASKVAGTQSAVPALGPSK